MKQKSNEIRKAVTSLALVAKPGTPFEGNKGAQEFVSDVAQL